MDQRKKSDENNIIESILKEGEDIGDVDLGEFDVDAILKDEINVKENDEHRTESTLVSLKTDIPKILREGAILKEEIEKVLSLDNF